MNKKTKQRIVRGVAMYLALNLLAEFIIPIPALALTSGPSQPEVESFEPVSTTEMVNLFTGDFNYNIPLMTVPGPNGGYPINMAYHAGIGMEQEASWCGLGWNINPGVINRNMRGVPDDFDGDLIKKTVSYNPQRTWALNYLRAFSYTNTVNQYLNSGDSTYSFELFGFDDERAIPTFSAQIHYNNYRGVGMGVSANITTCHAETNGTEFALPLTISYDVDGGIGVSPSLSYSKYSKNFQEKYSGSLSFGYNSRNGLFSMKLNAHKDKFNLMASSDQSEKGKKRTENYYTEGFYSTKAGGGVTFSSCSAIPYSTLHSGGVNLDLGISFGKSTGGSSKSTEFINRRFNASYSENYSTEINQQYNAYGFCNLGNAGSTSITDFNRGKNAPANKNASAIGVGYGTPDIFFATGQGMSGVFRAWRSEIGVFSDPVVESAIVGERILLENSTTHVTNEVTTGADMGVNYSHSYSGEWTGLISDLSTVHYSEFNPAIDPPDYEPVYYKSSGEMTASPINELEPLSFGEAIRFNIRNILDADEGIVPRLVDELVSDQTQTSILELFGNNERTARQKRSQLMSTRTCGQISSTIGYGTPIVSIYAANEFPLDDAPTVDQFDYSSKPDNHIGEITITNPDGTRYIYGLPAYNNVQREVLFTKSGFDYFDDDKTKSYDSLVDNSIANTQGNDHLFMSTEIPQYAYSYLITAIYSADYVDLTGNGPTNDDFGYWIKFNYTKHKDAYGWRIPYRDASYSKGFISDERDDKLSYTYGTKEIYYLNSVETKTHLARFILNDEMSDARTDGNGARSENFITGNSISPAHTLRFLDRIELLSKADPQTILKTVHFDYDYSLCSSVDNSTGTLGETGKLTLKKVWFTYLGNEKGQLSPYLFSYTHDVPVTTDDPDYNLDRMDRWGNYAPDVIGGVDGQDFIQNENPYVNQSAYNNDVDSYADAWNLKKITLPSGGDIQIEYESDDYAYVQNHRAMQMQRIVGFGDTTTFVGGTGIAAANGGSNVTDRNVLIFFDLERTLSGALTDDQLRDSIFRYVDGIDDLYFKAYMKLKRKPGHILDDRSDFAHDYVEGYAKVDRSGNWYGYTAATGPGSGTVTMGWIKVALQERNPWNPLGRTDHPIKLAGWQYLRLERPDLFEDGDGFDADWSMNNVIAGFINLLNDFNRLVGYYNFCGAHNYCQELYIQADPFEEDPKPSWIRLNSPDMIKYGGGHRVKEITITDNWENMALEDHPITAIYGTTYEYRMPDGTSSGVAEYEPLIGGEENPFRKPLRYEEKKYPYRNDGLYAEEPFCEGLYPAPNVGYRRVVVRSINHENENVTINQAGTTVTEFFTAKDFPLLMDYTDLEKKGFGIPVVVPFIGEISYNNKGYSQGFSLELNNMHGQIKSQSVYGVNADITDPALATSRVEYIYQTDPVGGPNGEPKLSSRATVLTQDGVYEQADIGKTNEFYIDRQQHSSFSISAGLQVNAGAAPPYVFWGNLFPYFDITRTMYRSVATMKIIQRNGVLSEVREYKDGAFTSNKTLMYDAETGQPLLTQTINNYNRPVYTYNYAAHWAYDGMGPAYKNVGANFVAANIVSGVFNISDVEKYFVVGDEVQMNDGVNNEIIWVSAVNASTGDVTFIDETGTLVSSGTYDLKILRSGRRNQQIATNGVIVSLSNPVTDRQFPFFTAMNSYDTTGMGNGNTAELNDFYTDCFTGILMDVDLSWNNSTHTLSILTSGGEGGCEASIVYNDESNITVLKDVFNYNLFYSAATEAVIAIDQNGSTLNCTFTAPDDCFHNCLDNVLHAEAYRFNDTWDFNYLDFGNPQNDAKSTGLEAMADNVYPNPYRFGTAGIWRMEESWLYQVDRKQTTGSPSMTSTPGDGTYKHFVLHSWAPSADHKAQNPQWDITNTVTMYDPHGYELENRNALGIYSSALYDSTRSVPIAVCSNCMYREQAFEGFEDYAEPTAYEHTAAHGHCHFTSVNPGSPIEMTTDYAHTGNYSLAVGSSGSAEMSFDVDASDASFTIFNPIGGRQYHLSVWVKSTAGSTPYVSVEDVTGSTTLATASPDMSRNAIDGWRQVNLDFTAPAAHNCEIVLDCSSPTSGICYFDDLRIQPFTSGMKTYVYNPLTFWLVAELDDRNFATFYNYDEQGALVQVKKETENGIVTVRTSRSNTRR